MNTPRKNEAFHAIDANAVEWMGAPDPAFDWVFMMTEHDWALVQDVWAERSSQWREALAYFVADGPADESRQMLLRALRDPADAVAQQAAISLCNQFIEYPEDRITIDTESIRLIREVVARAGDAEMEPVPAFLADFGD